MENTHPSQHKKRPSYLKAVSYHRSCNPCLIITGVPIVLPSKINCTGIEHQMSSPEVKVWTYREEDSLDLSPSLQMSPLKAMQKSQRRCDVASDPKIDRRAKMFCWWVFRADVRWISRWQNRSHLLRRKSCHSIMRVTGMPNKTSKSSRLNGHPRRCNSVIPNQEFDGPWTVHESFPSVPLRWSQFSYRFWSGEYLTTREYSVPKIGHAVRQT